MWKYVGGGFIPGVPTADMTDEEFEAVCEEYDKQFSADQKGSLKRSPLYKHSKDGPPEPPAAKED